MASPPSSADLAAKSAKLADNERPVRHGRLYGIRVISRDGKPVTVTWQIDTHRAEARPYVLNDVAARLRLPDSDSALEALTKWSREKLIAHLQQFDREHLLPPAMKRLG